MKRYFAIRHPIKPKQVCIALPALQRQSQDVFSEVFPKLLDQVSKTDFGFSSKLLAVTKRLAGKQKRLFTETSNLLLDRDPLNEKVYTQLLQHLDDRRVTTNEDLVQACYLLESMQDDGVDL